MATCWPSDSTGPTNATRSTWPCSPTCPAPTGCWSPTTRCVRACFSRTAITSRRASTWSTSDRTSSTERCRFPTTAAIRGGWTATWTKPVVAAAHGWCMTLGIELLLAADIRVAAADTRFCQMEVRARDLSVRRRHHPAAAADRLGQCDAVAAHRATSSTPTRRSASGCVQEVAADAAAAQASARARSRTPSPTVPPRSGSGPLWRRRTWRASEGDAAAIERLRPEMTRLFGSADAAEGVQSFIERREARFQGR